MRSPMLTVLIAGIVLLSPGCSNPLSPDSLAGVYRARTLLVVERTPAVDLLALGVTLTIRLQADGTTSGRFSGPLLAGVEDTPFDMDLTGRYTVENGAVRFSHDADTFLRDVPWTVQDGRLVASTAQLSAVLER